MGNFETTAAIAFPEVNGQQYVEITLKPDPYTTVHVINTPLDRIAMTRRDGVDIPPVLNDEDYHRLSAIKGRDIFKTGKDLGSIRRELEHVLAVQRGTLTQQQREAICYMRDAIHTILTIPYGRMIMTETSNPSQPTAS